MKYIYLIPLLFLLVGCGEYHDLKGTTEVIYYPSYLKVVDGDIRFNSSDGNSLHEFGFKTLINGSYITEVDRLSSNDVLFLFTNYPDLKFPVNIKLSFDGVSSYRAKYYIGEKISVVNIDWVAKKKVVPVKDQGM